MDCAWNSFNLNHTNTKVKVAKKAKKLDIFGTWPIDLAIVWTIYRIRPCRIYAFISGDDNAWKDTHANWIRSSGFYA
jgi:hypothetical protein